MRERVRALGGHLSIDSPRGRGTVLLVTVPLPQAKLLAPASAGLDEAASARVPTNV
jgi:two-component system sensor histidine kinase DesK